MFKKVLIFTVLIFSLIFTLSGNLFVSAEDSNLIANSSVETSQNSLPSQWSKENWGTLTPTYTYLNNGHIGSKSLYIKVSGYKNGDAKWVFNPVSVSANTTYQFSDYYKSTVKSDIVVRFIDSSNKETYLDLGEQSPADNWTKIDLSFTTKANTAKITILHLLSGNGELTTDDYSLTTDSSPVPTGTVPNSSLETVSSKNVNLPEYWSQDKWGNNTSKFEYLNSGYTGDRSVKVTVSGYKTGDAKWIYAAQPLTKGQYYQFSDYYKSNVSTELAVMYTKTDGSQDFLELPNAPVSTTWRHYTGYFTVPNDATNVAIIHFIAMNGYLQTDDYSVTPATYTPLNRALITLTFDNGYEDNSITAVPTMDAAGIKSTQCFSTEYLEADHSWDHIVKDFYNDGQEICSHSAHHADITNLNKTQLDYEYGHSNDYLDNLTGVKGSVQNYISPLGTYSDLAFTEAQNYYTSFRSTDDGYNTRDNMNFYNLHVQNILNTTTADEVKNWVDNAMVNKSWLVLVYHRVATKNVGEYDTTPALFNAQLKNILDSQITVKTTADAIKEIAPQLDK